VSPYYGFEDVRRHDLSGLLRALDPVEDDDSSGSSWFALPLFQLLARANLKSVCQEHWPSLTTLSLLTFAPNEAWQYCLFRNDGGTERSQVLPLSESWPAVVALSRDDSTREIPQRLRAYPEMVMLWTLLYPYRCTPEVIRWLSRVYWRSWY